jgi:hypothetical protein
VRVSRTPQHAQARLPVPLEAVWRASRLERATAKHLGACALHGRRRGHALFLGFRGTGPGHDDYFVATYAHIVEGDDRVFGLVTATRTLVRLGDAQHFVDAVENLDHFLLDLAGADDPKHRARGARRSVYVHPQLDEPRDDRVDLRLGGPLFHYNNHDVPSALFRFQPG